MGCGSPPQGLYRFGCSTRRSSRLGPSHLPGKHWAGDRTGPIAGGAAAEAGAWGRHRPSGP
jgi:hypothetical protein